MPIAVMSGKDLRSHPCGTNIRTEIQLTEAGLSPTATGGRLIETRHRTIPVRLANARIPRRRCRMAG